MATDFLDSFQERKSVNSPVNIGIMGESEKLFQQPSDPIQRPVRRSPVPDQDSTTPRQSYDAKRHASIKSDPALYAAYLDRKRRERHARQTNKQYETERKRKWRAANPDKNQIHRRAHHAVENAIRTGKLIRPERCELCRATSDIEAHHHLGYEREHWLAVRWLCPSCHAQQHRTGFGANT